MTTLSAMKERVAREIRRDDLTTEIAEAINVAIDSYKNRRFAFNASAFVDAPASDLEAGNAWMTTAEPLVRSRAKFELYLHVIRKPEVAEMISASVNEALDRLRLSVQHLTEATTTAGTLGRMKARIANEIDRADMTQQIANAISTAIAAYKYQRFSFNTTFVDEPALDGDAGNPWMVEAESLIRHRAKAELYSDSSPIADAKKAAECMAMADRALGELRTSRTHQTSTTAGTLGRMKQRIANEIERSDLGAAIADAIDTAIEAYQDKEFRFNETRDIELTLEADKDTYDETDLADLGRLEKLHFVKIYISDVPVDLRPLRPDEIEAVSAATQRGDPESYCWFGNQIRFYPLPITERTVRIGATVAIGAPADDTEASNAWMTDAERLIRSRAKLELALHVLSNTPDPQAQAKAASLATAMEAATNDAYTQLKDKQAQMNRVGLYVVEPMEF